MLICSMTKHLFPLLLCAIISISLCCSEEQEESLSDQRFEKLTTVLAELSVGFELAQRDTLDYFPIRDSILEMHEVDTAWLRESTERLGEDPEVWSEVWKAIEGDLETLKDSLTP